MCIFHSWSKWETIEGGEIQQLRWDYREGCHRTHRVGRWTLQRRQCTRCGKVKMNNVRALL